MKGEKISVVIGIGLMIVVWSIVFGLLMWHAMNRQEVVECNEWQKQAQEYDQFFLVQWQADQCRAHGIIINAPIRQK